MVQFPISVCIHPGRTEYMVLNCYEIRLSHAKDIIEIRLSRTADMCYNNERMRRQELPARGSS